MARCGPNLKLQRACFHSRHGGITALGFKIEKKYPNQCLGGLRIENQGVQSPQTFLVKTYFFTIVAKTRRSEHFQVSFDDISHI